MIHHLAPSSSPSCLLFIWPVAQAPVTGMEMGVAVLQEQGWDGFSKKQARADTSTLRYPQWMWERGEREQIKSALPREPLSSKHHRWSYLHAQLLSHVQLFAAPRTLAHQAPLSMGFSRQEYWSGLPLPTPEDLSDLEIELPFLGLLHWQVDSLPLVPPGKSHR